MQSLVDDGRGGYRCAPGEECKVGADNPTIACSAHGKQRSLQNLIDDGMGGMRCAPGYECRSNTQGSGGAGPSTQLCSLHGKMRSVQSLMDDGQGGFRCIQGDMCKGVSNMNVNTMRMPQTQPSMSFVPDTSFLTDATLSAEHIELVARVKAVQRMDGGRELWAVWCTANGGGKKDPASRAPEALRAFLAEADPLDSTAGMGAVVADLGSWGSLGGPTTSSLGGAALPADLGSAMGGPEHAHAVAKVKAVQRTPGGTDKWHTYVESHNSTRRDPAQKPLDFLNAFLAEADPSGAIGATVPAPAYDPQALYGLSMAPAMSNTVMAQDTSMMSWGLAAAPAKPLASATASKFHPQSADHALAIARVKAIQASEQGREAWHNYCSQHSSGKREPAAYSAKELGDFLEVADPTNATATVPVEYDEHQGLVTAVKTGQRTSEPFREMWTKYCDEQGGGHRDPSRHPVEFLRSFLAIAPSATNPQLDEQHQELVKRVKTLQRTQKEFQEAWWQHCDAEGGGRHDPARHTTAFLETFLFSFESSKPSLGGATPVATITGPPSYRYTPY